MAEQVVGTHQAVPDALPANGHLPDERLPLALPPNMIIESTLRPMQSLNNAARRK